MTHPFPLSNQPGRLRRLDQSCHIGVAHNGIIRLTSDPNNKRYSDTAIFVADYLSQILHTRADLRDRRKLSVVYQLAQSNLPSWTAAVTSLQWARSSMSAGCCSATEATGNGEPDRPARASQSGRAACGRFFLLRGIRRMWARVGL